MSKHPLKQKQVNVDSLANAAYEKWYAKNVKPKQDALADAAEVKKFDDTYLKRDESLPVYNTKWPAQPAVNIPANRFVQKVKNFSKNVKNFLSAHADRYKKQREIPMPRWNNNDSN